MNDDIGQTATLDEITQLRIAMSIIRDDKSSSVPSSDAGNRVAGSDCGFALVRSRLARGRRKAVR